MTIKKTFVDALAGGAIRSGVVRLDFGEVVVAHADKREDNETPSRFEAVHRMYMPIAGFMQTFQVMQKMMARIEEEKKKQGVDQLTVDSDS